MVNQFHDYLFELELDLGAPYKPEAAKVLVTLFDTALFELQRTGASQAHDPDHDKARLAHYVIQRLNSLIPSASETFPIKLNPTVEDVSELQKVDPTRVDAFSWRDVPREPSSTTKHRVFVSCGQQSDVEVALGNAILQAVKDHTCMEGYFAEEQHNLDGLTRNIFNAIHGSSAFIGVIHRRDKLPRDGNVFRGSVFVEQEIAIASFLVQSLGLSLPVRVYAQKGVIREGIRNFIHLNPIEFEENDEVIADLENFWREIT